jgi:hypothetical protein
VVRRAIGVPYQARVQTQDVVGVFFGLGYWCLALACPWELEVLTFRQNLGVRIDKTFPCFVRSFLAAQHADHVEHARLGAWFLKARIRSAVPDQSLRFPSPLRVMHGSVSQ